MKLSGGLSIYDLEILKCKGFFFFLNWSSLHFYKAPLGGTLAAEAGIFLQQLLCVSIFALNLRVYICVDISFSSSLTNKTSSLQAVQFMLCHCGCLSAEHTPCHATLYLCPLKHKDDEVMEQ